MSFPYSKVDADLISELRNNGVSIREIAFRVGRSPGAVDNYCKKYKIYPLTVKQVQQRANARFMIKEKDPDGPSSKYKKLIDDPINKGKKSYMEYLQEYSKKVNRPVKKLLTY